MFYKIGEIPNFGSVQCSGFFIHPGFRLEWLGYDHMSNPVNAKAILTRKKFTTTFYQHEYKSQWPSVKSVAICGKKQATPNLEIQ